nr:uncharacterized protein LOC109407241 [Aedes albopictus]
MAAKSNQSDGGNGRDRGPVKSRLGYSPYQKEQWRNKQRQDDGRTDQTKQWQNRGQSSEERNRPWIRPDYSQMICNFCGVKGHIKRKCFKLKNMQRDAINMVEASGSGHKERDDYMSDLVNRMRTESDSESEVEDSNWKRANGGSSRTASFE